MRFFRQFQHLVPFSEAWRSTLEKQLRQFFEGLAEGTQNPAVEFVDDAYLQLFPDITDQLDEWETQFFGQPRTGLLETDRRSLLAARWKALGGQSPRYIQDVLQAAGFDLYVHEWWNIVANSTGQSVSVSSQATNPTGIDFNDDGTKLFVCDFFDGIIDEWDLSTAYDLATSVYSQSFNASAQAAQPVSVRFANSGARMYVADRATDTIYQYNLSTGYDLSTAVYSTLSLDVTTTDNILNGFQISPDGARVFFVGQQNNSAYQFNLSTAYEINTATDSGNTIDLSGQGSGMAGCDFNSDGTRFYVISASADKVFEYAVAAYDFSSSVFTIDFADVSSIDNIPQDVVFGSGSQLMFIVGFQTDAVHKFSVGASAKDPRNYTTQPLFGTTQCGDDGSAPNTPIAECGEQPPNQTSVLSATCNAFLINDVGYLVNENLTQQAPPPVPDDPSAWPYFLYIGAETFPDTAAVPSALRPALEDLLLRICPSQQWIVTLISYSASSGSFAYTFTFDLPA